MEKVLCGGTSLSSAAISVTPADTSVMFPPPADKHGAVFVLPLRWQGDPHSGYVFAVLLIYLLAVVF